MVCIHCGADTQVINSRLQKRNNQVWRRRKCVMCDTVFSTEEAVDYRKSIVVRGAQAQLCAFERDTLFLSLYASLSHRANALVEAGDLTATVVTKLRPYITDGSIAREHIIQVTVVTLNRFDSLATQHYQALHKD